MSEGSPPRSYPANRSPFREPRREPLLHRTLPVTRDLRGYRPGAARRDITAALTVAALAIPSAMAYAQVAGLTPVIGLYALLLPTVAYALLGSSRQVIVGPEGSLAALIAAARITPGVVVYRLDDRLFFANAGYFKGRIHEAVRGVPSEPHWLVLDAQAISHVDVAGMAALRELTGSLSAQRITLVVARMMDRVGQQLIDAGVADEIGRDHFYPTVGAAVAAFTERERGSGTATSPS